MIGETFIATHCCSSSNRCFFFSRVCQYPFPFRRSVCSILIFFFYTDTRIHRPATHRSSQLMLLSDWINGCGLELMFLLLFCCCCYFVIWFFLCFLNDEQKTVRQSICASLFIHRLLMNTLQKRLRVDVGVGYFSFFLCVCSCFDSKNNRHFDKLILFLLNHERLWK